MRDKERDARAAEQVLGWEDVVPVSYMNSDGTSTVYWRGTVPSKRNEYGVAPRADLPHFGSDPAAARLLVEALKPEERRRFVRALMNKVLPVAWAHEGPIFRFDYEEVIALLLAPPAAIRDAVLEVKEGNNGI